MVEPVEELAGGDEIVNGFCEKPDEQSLAIGGRAAASGRRLTTEASSWLEVLKGPRADSRRGNR